MIRPLTTGTQPLQQRDHRPQEPSSPSPESDKSLSTDEKQLIEAFFPASKRMELRLYGPTRPLAPPAGGLGARIDLKG